MKIDKNVKFEEFDFPNPLPPSDPRDMIVWNNDPSVADVQAVANQNKIVLAIFINDPEGAKSLAAKFKDKPMASYLFVYFFNPSPDQALDQGNVNQFQGSWIPDTQEDAREFLLGRMEETEVEWFAPKGMKRDEADA